MLTGRLALTINIASTARCFGVPNGTDTSPMRTCSGPKTPNWAAAKDCPAPNPSAIMTFLYSPGSPAKQQQHSFRLGFGHAGVGGRNVRGIHDPADTGRRRHGHSVFGRPSPAAAPGCTESS